MSESIKNICENCGKEHDGSYGSGRFCCDSCRRSFNGKRVKTRVNNLPNNKKEGGWKCCYCEEVFETRRALSEHKKVHRPGGKSHVAWNKGLTKETSSIVAQYSKTWLENYKLGKIKTSYKHTDESKSHLRDVMLKRMSDPNNLIPFVRLRTEGRQFRSKGEIYFEEALRKRGVEFQMEKREHPYVLDFVIGKVDVEIDGESHYINDTLIEKDVKRTAFLEERGYKVIRIRWKEFRVLLEKEKDEIVDNILKQALEYNKNVF